ncbi:MAG: multicopper oxidase domain-containing protein [Anaerolineae bacterium]
MKTVMGIVIAAVILAPLACTPPTPSPEGLLQLTQTAAAGEPGRPLDAPNVAKDPADLPPPITRTQPSTVAVSLMARELTAELADGTSYVFWTFDGTVPGSLIRVMEGDTVEVTLVNPPENQVAHNIDLQAVNGPGGGGAVTSVEPGETKTFAFKATHPGAYVYHCALSQPWHHVAQGMYGAILVEPRGGLAPVDREYFIMQGEWYTRGSFGERGHQEFSQSKALSEDPELFTFNGHAAGLTQLYPLQASVGETVRFFFGAGGPNLGANLHIFGEIFDKVYSGSPDTFLANQETWYVPPGAMAAFEFELDVPGNYVVADHALYRMSKGAMGLLVVGGHHDESLYSPPAPRAGG